MRHKLPSLLKFLNCKQSSLTCNMSLIGYDNPFESSLIIFPTIKLGNIFNCNIVLRQKNNYNKYVYMRRQYRNKKKKYSLGASRLSAGQNR